MATPGDRSGRAAARRRGARTQAGFTFLGLLFLIFLMGLMAAAAATTWTFSAQRDKELDLLFAGREYRFALGRYAAAHARQPQPYPTSLAQLLDDPGQLTPVRYLRRLYFDPMTGNSEWGLVRNARGGITGVYSLSAQAPVRRQAFDSRDGIDFAKATSYRDWIFRAALAPAMPEAPAAGAPPGWNREQDGEPPLTWESAPPAPVVVPDPQ